MRYGVKEAVILSFFIDGIKKSKENKVNFHEGKYWVYGTYVDLQARMPFFPWSSLKKLIQRLERQGALVSNSFARAKMDKTKWYTLPKDRYAIEIDGQTSTDCEPQMGLFENQTPRVIEAVLPEFKRVKEDLIFDMLIHQHKNTREDIEKAKAYLQKIKPHIKEPLEYLSQERDRVRQTLVEIEIKEELSGDAA